MDLSRVVTGFARARKDAEEWARLNPEAAAGVDIREVAAKMATARALVRTFGQTTATKTVEIKVKDEFDRTKRRIASLEQVITNASDERIVIEAEAQVAAARIKLEQLRTLAVSVGLTDPDVDVDVNVGGMTRFKAAMAAIPREVNAAKNRFNNAMYTMRNVGQVAFNALIISIIGSVGPLSAAVLSATAGLAVIGGGFGLIGLAASQAFSGIKVENGKLVADTGVKLSRAQRMMVKAMNGFAQKYRKAMAPARDAVASILARSTGVAETALPAIGKAALTTTEAFGVAIDDILNKGRQPRQVRIFKSFLNELPGLTQSATTTAGNFFLGLFNMIQPAIKPAKDFAGYLEDASERFLEWSKSKQGREQIAEWLDKVLPVAQGFGKAVGKVVDGVFEFSNSKGALKLFGELAELGGTLGKNLPKLEPMLSAIGNVIGKFNALPPGLQSIIVTTLASTVLFNALGGGFVIGLAGAITKLLLVKGLFSRVKAIGSLAESLKTIGKSGGGTVATGGKGAPPAVGPVAQGGKFAPPVVPAPTPARGFWGKFMQRVKALPLPRGATLAKGGAIGLLAAVTIGGVIANARELPALVSSWAEALRQTMKKPFGDAAVEARSNMISKMFGMPLVPGFIKWFEPLYQWANTSGAKRWNGMGAGLRKALIAGLVAGLKATPFIGPLISVFQVAWNRIREWWGTKSPSRRMRALGRDIMLGLLEGLKRVPVIGPIIKKAQDLYQGARRAFRKGGWRGLGAYVVQTIADGLKRTPLGGVVQKAQRLFQEGRRAFRRGGWRGLGSYVIETISSGLKGTRLFNLASRVGAFFSGARQAFRQKGWRGLGSYVVDAISSGLKGTRFYNFSQKVGTFFSGARQAYRQKGWRGLGSYVVETISAGLKGTKFYNFGSKVAAFFGGARQAYRSKGWRGLGSYVVDTISSGLKGTRFYNFGSKVATFFSGARQAYRSKGWRGLGSYVVDTISSGLKGTRFYSFSSKVATFFSGANRAFKSRGWRGLGQYVVNTISSGIKGTRLASLVDKAQSAYNSLSGYIRDGRWRNLGSDIVAGIRNGITGAWNIGSVLEDLAKNAWERVKNFFQSKSPSRLMMWLGRTLPQGLAGGIEAESPKAVRGAENMARRVAEAMKVRVPKVTLPRLKVNGVQFPDTWPFSEKNSPFVGWPFGDDAVGGPQSGPGRPGPGGSGAVTKPKPTAPKPKPSTPPAPVTPPAQIGVNPVVNLEVPYVQDLAVAEEMAIAAAEEQIRAAFGELKQTGPSNVGYVSGTIS